MSGSFEANSIVVNGDFESGNTGFSSTYTYGTGSQGLYPEGTYSVVTTASSVHPNFLNSYDHTLGNNSGHYMAVNGSGSPNTTVWSQTITVLPHTDYIFYTWVISLVSGTASTVAQLQFSINNNLIGSVFTAPISTSTGWQQFYTTWNSGNSTTALIKIVNQNTTLSGNDFGLDDIHFAPVLPATDSVIIHVNYPVASYDTVVVCNGGTYDFNGQLLSSTGAYTDTLVSAAGCDSVVHLQLYYSEEVTVNLGEDKTFCAEVQHSFTLTPGDYFSYLWSDNSTGSSLTVNESNSYSVTVSDEMGCTASDTVTLTFIETPNVVIQNVSEPFCDSYSAQLVANSDAEAFSWNTGETTPSIIVTFPGTYSVIAKNWNCTRSAAYTIEECEFNLYFPNSITCDGNGLNDYFQLSSTDNIQTIEVSIFDRYGKLIFTSTDVNFQWDGSVNGKWMNGSIYNYVVVLKTFTGPRHLYKGSITVLLQGNEKQ